MEFVTEWIAIGDRHDARNIKALKEAHIEAVICVADWVRVPRKKYKKAGIVYTKLPIVDSKPIPEDAEIAFVAALQFLDLMVLLKKRCLVHCAMGISRSTAFIATWLHTRLGMDWDEAVAYIRRVRPIVNPQPEPFASMKKIAYY
ncbi:MAG: hypothetical protein A2806_01840 [Candidatus Terrybacteria bacterium RIFCSPHIGHO2_01_FULL_48_17]|uniref:Tyrosine specific protein phosphatases domain-containing protein n=1 Tax=Candidatus Terrybacteria bacterium RIFCSPHIGHO2_01_FULL_48_17 TaxID=1802362 RepID=A0A1G2PL63_9BACT|nr:MAG: hypothetical protein A2806_01840 [Candidatus Terrybacteria bacterium RIFCSPHIGHO2_01_FULL_48_17]OHA52654.1 MAG: hypothetical protein A3A30_03455 [Candidatus Terrybacteria bacterium RIFCSPLOWO2_01_FULL_48_14]